MRSDWEHFFKYQDTLYGVHFTLKMYNSKSGEPELQLYYGHDSIKYHILSLSPVDIVEHDKFNYLPILQSWNRIISIIEDHIERPVRDWTNGTFDYYPI